MTTTDALDTVACCDAIDQGCCLPAANDACCGPDGCMECGCAAS
jgi:hypothetical protein